MKRTSSPRKRFTPEERRTLLAAFRDGQLSARDFVHQHGLSLAALYRWRQPARPGRPARAQGQSPACQPSGAAPAARPLGTPRSHRALPSRRLPLPAMRGRTPGHRLRDGRGTGDRTGPVSCAGGQAGEAGGALPARTRRGHRPGPGQDFAQEQTDQSNMSLLDTRYYRLIRPLAAFSLF